MSKLVRDTIPAIIRDAQKEPVFHLADEKEYVALLREKLLEEVHEFLEDDTVDELADIQEVLLALYVVKGITKEDVELARLAKKEKRGGFEKRIVLDTVKE